MFFAWHHIFSMLPAAASVAEPHHFYAGPAPGKNFDAASAPKAPAPTLLYNKGKFLKELKFKLMFKLSSSYDSVRFLLLKI
jgi:hypothetical protein